jgi:holo-[acyl-carrier protein] synthase
VDGPAPRVSIGSDIVEVARVERLITRYERAERRLFTEAEIDYCRARRNWHEHMAARFAAKEAVLKALGTGLGPGMRWTDVEVVNEDNGRPVVRLSGEVAAFAERTGVRQLELSLSHTSGLALAQALAVHAEP